jgi:multimeric flavodoxin WrbA
MSLQKYKKTLVYLKGKKKVLFLTTSNRWNDEIPKSSSLAHQLKQELGNDKCTIIDVSKLVIYPCEGNVSQMGKVGNHCGTKDSALKDKEKNPSGHHRCWASLNHNDDELWRISKELLECEAVVFFGSIRWGKMNAIYAKLIERLTWLENRHSTLGESNILKNIEAGVIAVGHNWNGKEAVEHEKEVLSFFGFKLPDELSWSYQWTQDKEDESADGYKKDIEDFEKEFNFIELVKESILKFKSWVIRTISKD